MYVKDWFLILLVCSILHISNTHENEKLYQYIEATNAFYKFYTKPTTYIAADQICESEGANLFYPKNEAEARAVTSFWKKNQDEVSLIYVGITDMRVFRKFEPIDGNPLTYINWRSGEPNNAGGQERCVLFEKDGTFIDDSCYTGRAFICKKNSNELDWNNKSNISTDARENIKIFRPDYRYIETTQAFYKFHTQAASWTVAKQMCESEGARLFYPKNEAEMRAVSSFWIETHDDVGLIYLGLTDLLAKGNFVPIDGSPLTYIKWHSGEPNDAAGNERCVLSYKDGTFLDDSCLRDRVFICKKSANELEWYNLCNTSNTDALENSKIFRADYRYIETTQAFYKFHTQAASWTVAKQMCESEGARLFYPKNEVEMRAVSSFWVETHDDVDLVYLGITDLLVKGKFVPIDGSLITYLNWHSGEPNDAAGNERCVLSYKDGTFIDDSCLRDRAFICKKSSSEQQLKKSCKIANIDANENRKIFRADYRYIETTQAFYKFHTEAASWTVAKQRCRSEGARLFYPKNEAEMRAVTSFWVETHDDVGLIYLGITDLVVKGNFVPFDGSLLTYYLKWHSGEPNDAAGNERCVLSYKDGTFLDDSCLRDRVFICKKSSIVQELNKKCNIPNIDYTYNEEEGKCYKFHKKAMSWTDANSTCNDEQAYLAVINSQRERDYLVSLTRASSDQITEVLQKGKIHLGFHNRLDEGWQTLQGTTLENSGYAGWDVDQPDGQKCGSMSYTGQLHDVECNSKRYFICEHEFT